MSLSRTMSELCGFSFHIFLFVFFCAIIHEINTLPNTFEDEIFSLVVHSTSNNVLFSWPHNTPDSGDKIPAKGYFHFLADGVFYPSEDFSRMEKKKGLFGFRILKRGVMIVRMKFWNLIQFNGEITSTISDNFCQLHAIL